MRSLQVALQQRSFDRPNSIDATSSSENQLREKVFAILVFVFCNYFYGCDLILM